MRWIEVIRLRSSGEDELNEVANRLRRSFSEKLQGELQTVRIYCNAAVGTDLAVHLVYETSGGCRPDTSVGEQLSAALEAHGITDLSLWFETPPE